VNRIVCDASPLIVIAKSGLIPVLGAMIAEVIIPQAVYDECTVDVALPGAQAIRRAMADGKIGVHPGVQGPDSDVPAVLGAGERAAIDLAVARNCAVLMDERMGRHAAHQRGLTVIGSAGLLLVAKQRGLIPAIAPILEQWRQAGYFLSANVVRSVLLRADEALNCAPS
jgi:predicted nucleic acid-binding protein